MAGGIAGNFSHLLTVINGRAKLLLERPALPPDVAESLREICTAGGRAAGLIRQLLVFSQQQDMQMVPVDLNRLIADHLGMLRGMLGGQTSLEFRPGDRMPPVLADAGMLEQVMLNLGGNAGEAMTNGGRLTISTETCEITGNDRQRQPEARPGLHVCLQFSDTGRGIAPEHRTRVFEPFYTTKVNGRGAGLGLAVVHGIVKRHGGWIELESEVGAGTTFRLFLPACPDGLVAPPAAVGRGHETILLVDDEPAVRELAWLILQEYGYRVLQAESVTSALEIWRWHSHRIALLLTDLLLPDDLTGLELAARLRAEKPALKVIVMSGLNPGIHGPDPRELAGVDFLHKSFSPEALGRMVRAVLDRGIDPASPVLPPSNAQP